VKNHLPHVGPVVIHWTPKEIATILREQRYSGLSLLAFARKHQLCYATLLRWRSRHLKRARSGAAPPTAGPGFIPIQIEAGSLHLPHLIEQLCGLTIHIHACTLKL